MSNAPVPWPSIQDVHTVVFDFDGVFTDNKVYVGQNGKEWVRCDRRDGLAIDMLRHYRKKQGLNLDLFILSTERNSVVAARASKLKLDYKQGVGNKLEYVQRYLAERHPDVSDAFSGLVFLGNDLNDLPVLEHAGFSIVPSDAHENVRAEASVVLPQTGGQGFVREAIERLLNLSSMTREEIHGLVCNR
jgi:3-deoxy-D-manno-octulosonate 8-phosphate phosphatase (KDO 8-P phosphatase)